MSEVRRQRILDYLMSLGISLGVSLCFLPLMRLPADLNVGVVAIVSSLIFGNGFYVLGYIRYRVRLPRFWVNVAVQTTLMFLTLLVCFCITVWMIGWANSHVSKTDPHRLSPFNPDLLRDLALFVFNARMLSLGLVGLLVAMLINAFFQFDRKLGPGVLWNWVTGKYYDPREEELIFMFLDLKDSTRLAEQLGTLKFSALVRDFFHDMTDSVLESKGSVSHYIGDEAVIFWKPKRGLDKGKCLRMFFDFQTFLRGRSEHYLQAYGVLPAFKAGAHIGPVVATEVGEIKSEIVFHGDTLNTTARIQSLCNELGVSLLVSSDLASRITLPDAFQLRALGEHILKGKEQPVEIFSVELA